MIPCSGNLGHGRAQEKTEAEVQQMLIHRARLAQTER